MKTTDYQHLLMHHARAEEIYRDRAQWRLAVEATAGHRHPVYRPVREISLAALLRLFLRRRVSSVRRRSDVAEQPAASSPPTYPRTRASCAITIEV
ncbi:MAG: hypothetical protein IPK19_12460 [Chloroflexi bacterium]|nr:hypothetical protein [Chloroflexota bacterium]